MPTKDKSSSRRRRRAHLPMKKNHKGSALNGGANGNDLPRTLVMDVGGSGIKATLVNDLGKVVGERLRHDTPASRRPGEVMEVVVSLSKQFEFFDRVAVGFPGVIVGGMVKQAPNFAKQWQGFNFADVLQMRLKKPVRVANDADVQGFGAISGKGVEVVVTLGTGVGTSLFVDGHLVPNLEMGKDKLRNEALQKVGKKKWNKRLMKFIRQLDDVFHFTKLYIGGGNSKAVDVALMPANVTIISNLNGLVGGIALWRDATGMFWKSSAGSQPDF
jgi:polyphosphate glucokinase